MSDEEKKFINLTTENLEKEHICCIIRSKNVHSGIEAKKKWLSERLLEGHVFRKLNEKATVFIEYAPLENAWVPIEGENYFYIYCLWTDGKNYRGKGHGKALMEYCIEDAKEKGKSGVCMLGATKQKAWLTNQAFAKQYGFEVVDSTKNGYELLALSFDGTKPYFTERAKSEKIQNETLTIYYDLQCPFVLQGIEVIKTYCESQEIPYHLIQVNTLDEAKKLPCVFNNWAVFYKGHFETVNLLLDTKQLERLIKKY